MGVIKLGSSGFSFKDWKGVIYPTDMPQSDFFSEYVKYFDTVEINSTYYGIPSEKVFAGLEEKTSPDFEFIVKVNQESTHILKKSEEAMASLHDVVSPLVKKDKLKGFLAQFPYGFKNAGHNRRHLFKLKQDCRDIPLIVEFRHISWDNQALYEFLRINGINYSCVDEPALNGLLPPQEIVTGDTGYVRFHGRNSETWWDSSKGDRYDYLYKTEELSDWIKRIREINRKAAKSYLFFNNCHAGHAVRNAKMMAELLKGQLTVDTIIKPLPEHI